MAAFFIRGVCRSEEIIMADQFDNEPMPANATRNLFVWASGFGIGALLVLAAFVFLIGVGEVGQHANSPATPAGQSAANAPVAPGPAPKPVQNTAVPAVPETTGSAPAPAQPSTPRAPTKEQQQQGQQPPQNQPAAKMPQNQ
jgi:hypothetical protein